MGAAFPAESASTPVGLRPTVAFREENEGGVGYNSAQRQFFRVDAEGLHALRSLARCEPGFQLPKRLRDRWSRAGWIGPEAVPRPFAEKPARTPDHPFRPLHTVLVATCRCNAACIFCCAEPYLRAYRRKKEFRSVEQMERLAERFHALGLVQCVVGGGEPTLVPQLDRLLRRLVGQAVFPTVISNGTVWVAEQYLQSAVEGAHWCLSYHSNDPDQHDSIMKLPGAHAKVRGVLSELCAEGMDPAVNLTVGNHNLPRLEEMIASLVALGVREITLSQQLQNTRLHEPTLSATVLGKMGETAARWRQQGVHVFVANRFRFLFDRRRTMMERLFPGFQGGCPGGIMESVTFADGSVHPCDYLWEEEFCAGNLFDDEGIERITTAPVFAMLQALPPDAACSDCPHFRICRGGCPGVRYMREGRLGYPNPECPLLEKNGDHA